MRNAYWFSVEKGSKCSICGGLDGVDVS